MPTRIPASERTSQKLNELLSHGAADGDARAELRKLAVRKIVEEALEAEVAEAVGRDYSNENGAVPGAGYRNGYRRGRLRTAEGPIEYGVPQVAKRAEPFVSRLRARLAGRTAELERLAVEMFARGLGTRDIEAAFQDETGASLLSRTTVSQVTERLWQEYEAFAAAARMSPAAPSVTTSRGSAKPRRLRSWKKAVQLAVSSFVPGARCNSTFWPSSVIPHAQSTASRGIPACSRSATSSTKK